MDWQDILKIENNPTLIDKVSFMKSIQKYTEDDEDMNWIVEILNPAPSYTHPMAHFTSKGNNGTGLTVKGYIQDLPNMRTIITEKNIEEYLKPSLRSLDWLVEVLTPMNVLPQHEDDKIEIASKEGKNYTINTTDLKSSGCYKVTTEEGYYICIEMSSLKPVGDNLVSLALGLLNDSESRDDIEGVEDYIYNLTTVECTVCGYTDNEVKITNEKFTCYRCEVDIYMEDISFEPHVTYSLNAEDIRGPNGWLEPIMSHITENEFLDGNKRFTLGNEDDYRLTVRGSANDILEHTSYYPDEESAIYYHDDRFYNHDGEYLYADDVFYRISGSVDNPFDFIGDVLGVPNEEIFSLLDFDNLTERLWMGNDGEYYSDEGVKLTDIGDIYEASGLTEGDFMTKASVLVDNFTAEDILTHFEYIENDDDIWTRDGKYYKINGEVIEEVDESEITKNLSSKAVLPINMKWTDYLKKTSNEVEDWESALKSFISDGKKLGIPLSVMELLKLAKEATTSQSEGFETLHRPTFSEEEEEDV